MIAKVLTGTLAGIDALPVTVECDVHGATPSIDIVGLPDKAVEESRHRVNSAIRHCNLSYPQRKIVVNLAPGDVRKEGAALDLPIAVAIVAASEQVPAHELASTMILGELGLDGRLRPIDGAVNYALLAMQLGYRRLLLPEENAPEAAVATGLDVYGFSTLDRVVDFLTGLIPAQPHVFEPPPSPEASAYGLDYSDVKGQRHAIRALEIAAAGGHNVLMVGPPGSGKTMLARRLPTILPPLSLEESIEVTRVHSVTGSKGGRSGLIWERPFRSPHHTSSYAAVVGGGKVPKPGEISLSHLGVLFMDEMPEFDNRVLESLRQPLEDGVVHVSRVQATMTFPAECILIGAMNPCPCGFKGYPEEKCIGSPATCAKYATRISGPLMDRIDLHLTVPRLKPEELIDAPPSESSAAIRARVSAARDRQRARLGPRGTNAKMTPRQIRDLVVLDEEGKELMHMVSSRLNLSARVFDRILKVARTLADLEGAELVRRTHLAEAVQYREPSR